MSNVKAILESYNKMKKARKEFFINGVLFFVSDPLPDGVEPLAVKKRIEKKIPKRLFQNLDYIFVGDFPELKLRDVQSVYMRGAIYINHENQTEDGLYKAIIHELAHSIETTFGSKIYEDNEVAAEFVGKRKQLRSILKTQGHELKDPTIFIRAEYNPEFDNFLYKEVGYDKLNQLCTGLFASPYGATSLREYFANGFEHFFLNDPEYLSKISPKLYSKILSLTSK
jgi:hypothetical protein